MDVIGICGSGSVADARGLIKPVQMFAHSFHFSRRTSITLPLSAPEVPVLSTLTSRIWRTPKVREQKASRSPETSYDTGAIYLVSRH